MLNIYVVWDKILPHLLAFEAMLRVWICSKPAMGQSNGDFSACDHVHTQSNIKYLKTPKQQQYSLLKSNKYFWCSYFYMIMSFSICFVVCKLYRHACCSFRFMCHFCNWIFCHCILSECRNVSNHIKDMYGSIYNTVNLLALLVIYYSTYIQGICIRCALSNTVELNVWQRSVHLMPEIFVNGGTCVSFQYIFCKSLCEWCKYFNIVCFFFIIACICMLKICVVWDNILPHLLAFEGMYSDWIELAAFLQCSKVIVICSEAFLTWWYTYSTEHNTFKLQK